MEVALEIASTEAAVLSRPVLSDKPVTEKERSSETFKTILANSVWCRSKAKMRRSPVDILICKTVDVDTSDSVSFNRDAEPCRQVAVAVNILSDRNKQSELCSLPVYGVNTLPPTTRVWKSHQNCSVLYPSFTWLSTHTHVRVRRGFHGVSCKLSDVLCTVARVPPDNATNH